MNIKSISSSATAPFTGSEYRKKQFEKNMALRERLADKTRVMMMLPIFVC